MSMAAPGHHLSKPPPEAAARTDPNRLSSVSPAERHSADDGDWLDNDGESYEFLALDEGWPEPLEATSLSAP